MLNWPITRKSGNLAFFISVSSTISLVEFMIFVDEFELLIFSEIGILALVEVKVFIE